MARTFSKNTLNYLSLGVNGINTLLSGASAVTIAAWCRPASFSGADNENRIVCELITGSGTTGLMIGGSSTGTLRVGARSQSGDGFQTSNGTTTLTTGLWYHVAATINFASPAIQPYLNGTAEGGSTPTFGASSYTPSSVTGVAMIGCVASSSTPLNTNTQFDGDIAEVAVWRAALSAGEIKSLANCVPPSRVRATSLAGYWPLHGLYSPETNYAGATPTGTVNGSLPTVAHPPTAPAYGGESDAILYNATPAATGTLLFFLRRQSGGFTEMDLA